jgi:hypothetical protein
MSKRKSIVPLNEARDSFNLFQDQLVPTITDVRGETVEVDLGDYLHGILDHPEMPERVNWIVETLLNPAEIRRHWDRRLRHREVYVNTIYAGEDDPDGELHLVIVERGLGRLRFWTTFVPLDREKYERLIRKGDLLWKPRN